MGGRVPTILLLTCRRSSCSSRRASRRARSSSRRVARSSVTSRSAAARPSSTSASRCSFSSLARFRLREGGEGAGITPRGHCTGPKHLPAWATPHPEHRLSRHRTIPCIPQFEQSLGPTITPALSTQNIAPPHTCPDLEHRPVPCISQLRHPIILSITPTSSIVPSPASPSLGILLS